MHARVTRYRLREGSTDQFVNLVREKWTPVLEKEDGFVNFELIRLDSEADEVVTILRFETVDGTMNALEKARGWIFQHAGDLVVEPSRMVMGDVVLEIGARKTANLESSSDVP